MVEDDLIVFNKDGERIEGTLRESVDTVALKYIFDQLPEVNAIIHTHQPYATAGRPHRRRVSRRADHAG